MTTPESNTDAKSLRQERKAKLLKAPKDTKVVNGRRKEATARVQIYAGDGKIQVNKRDISNYFGRATLQMIVRQPIEAVNLLGKLDVVANVRGGGLAGQAGAIRHAISRAIAEYDQTLKPILRRGNFLTRDPRMKERKKYGQKGARRRFQFSKR